MSHIDYSGPGELHITNINQAHTIDKSPFDHIITVCQEPIEDNVPNKIEYSYYCMADGPHNSYEGRYDYEIFKDASQELYTALKDDNTVLIHCHAGQSRSVSVSAAALGRLLEINFYEALDIIHKYRNTSQNPDRLLINHAEKYIEEHTGIDSTPFEGTD